MRAVQLTGLTSLCPLETRDPSCPPGGAVIKIEAVGLCSSDLKMWRRGHRDLILPRVLGHEVSGVVAALDGKHQGLSVGDRVQVAPGLPCRRCRACLEGATNRCREVQVLGFHLDGGLAEYLVLPGHALEAGLLTPLPPVLSWEEACLAEPLACLLNAFDRAKLTPGDKLVIFGAGFIGRLAAVLAVEMGAEVTLLETDPRRLEGLTVRNLFLETYDPQVLAGLTYPEGTDVILPACDDPRLMELSLSLLGRGGRLIHFSGLPPEQAWGNINFNQVHYLELGLVGAYGCTTNQNKEALKWLASGRLDVQDLITHCLGLDEVEKGLTLMAKHEALKVIIKP